MRLTKLVNMTENIMNIVKYAFPPISNTLDVLQSNNLHWDGCHLDYINVHVFLSASEFMPTFVGQYLT